MLLGRKSLWTDEAEALDVAQKSLGDLASHIVHVAPAQGLYPLLLAPVAALDDSPWMLRAPSAVAVALAALCVYAIGAALFDRTAGVIASLAFATSGSVVAASQQARPYGFALLAVSLTTLLLVQAFRHGRWWWLLYAVSLLLLPASHPIAASVVAAQGLAIGLHPARRGLRWWLVPVLVTAGVVAAWLVVDAVDRAHTADSGTHLQLEHLAADAFEAIGRNPLLLAVAVAGIAAMISGRIPSAAAWKSALVVGLALGPLVTILLAGTALPVLADRALVVAMPGVALACGPAHAWMGIRSRVDRRTLLIVAAATAIVALAWSGAWLAGPSIEDWRAALAEVRRRSGASEVVVVVPDRARSAAQYYAPGTPLRLQARGESAWVLVREHDSSTAIAAARSVVKTPRYALAEQQRYGDDLQLQHWVRP